MTCTGHNTPGWYKLHVTFHVPYFIIILISEHELECHSYRKKSYGKGIGGTVSEVAQEENEINIILVNKSKVQMVQWYLSSAVYKAGTLLTASGIALITV